MGGEGARAVRAGRTGELPVRSRTQAFDQVYEARGRGLPPQAANRPLRGQLFDIARILTLIATIEVSQDPDVERDRHGSQQLEAPARPDREAA